MPVKFLLPLAVIFFLVLACIRKGTSLPPPETVPKVDLSRYMGIWYEIARYPNTFQQECRNSTATYTLREDGTVTVVNRCRRDSGKEEAHGTAKVVDRTTNAKLKVTFFWPFYGDYWILALGTDYDYAVVGTPDRKYLWILSRTPEIEESRYQTLLVKIRELGFDPDRLLKEQPQPDSAPGAS
ncbi:MAG: lipocalin family protein [Geobacteraceae bacterium]|nr:lipocalin family protein [Geobacteraceae bacterium]